MRVAIVDVLDELGDHLRVRLRLEMEALAHQVVPNLLVVGDDPVVHNNKFCEKCFSVSIINALKTDRFWHLSAGDAHSHPSAFHASPNGYARFRNELNLNFMEILQSIFKKWA